MTDLDGIRKEIEADMPRYRAPLPTAERKACVLALLR